MDTFFEKIVAKRKDFKDILFNIGIVLAALLLVLIILNIPIVNQFGLIITTGIVYLAYRLIKARNIEFEYLVTNGDLDIDMIIDQRKRKRIFSANCKEFDIVAKVSSNHFNSSVQNIPKKILAASDINSPDAYFFTLNYKGERTLVVFEPDERMLNNFKLFIPRKVFE
ncbi:MAG TPA: hypothetical protein GXX20_05820 [Clostridiaceae bacterium]|nr:hypothetical protein [Clostridiaceae bacterium]